jgi:hypothetical protein
MRSLTGVPEASWAALIGRLAEEDDAADERTRCRVAGCPFVVRGLLAHGEHADVFLAERLYPTELCVLKVLRARADNAAFAREWGVLTRLSGDDAPEASFFTSLLPQPVLRGTLTSRNTSERAAMAYRWQSGFLYTLRDVAAAYPAGLDVETAVWLWRRTLHLLGWVHQVGVAHGAVNPEHVLVHPRDHRILLVGWSAAKDAGREAACGDLQMSAECIKLVLGARLESAPEALRHGIRSL